jgi:NAD(P)-dependent dehydrogenase (short-subunit alcohol dehydrogenase family)
MPSNSQSTDTKTIVLTGVTRGLGRSLVEPLSGLGHTVVGCGRSAGDIGELRDRCGPPHRFDAVDVADWPEVQAWAEDVLAGGLQPDLVINNAGVMNRPAPLWELGVEEFEQVLRVNVDGTANVIRAFVPSMIRQGRGVVVNMSSGWGRVTAPEVAPYCASKFAVEGLTKALAQELPAGLAAVAVNPGIIDTDMLRTCWDAGAAGFPTPEAWAPSAASFLLSLSVAHNGRSVTIGG